MPQAADDRAVVARLHRHVAARTEPRPDPRAHPVVGSLVEGHRQRRRPRAADHGVRATLDAAGARPRRGARRRGGTNRPGPPSASRPTRWPSPKAEADRDGDGPRPARRARRRGLDRLDLVRGRDALGPARRPTTRRDPFPHLHLGTARATSWRSWGRPGCGCASRRARRWPTCRPSCATCSPTALVLVVTRGMLNLTPATRARIRRRSSPAPVRHGARRSRRCRGRSKPGHRIRLDLAGSDWPNAWSPPEPVTLTIERATATLELPVLDGPVPSPSHRWSRRPTGSWPTPLPRNSPRTTRTKGWVVWDVAHHRCGTRSSPAPGAWATTTPIRVRHTVVPELYGGEVTVSTDDPGIASVTSRGAFELRFPEATCSSRVDITVTSDRDHYDVAIDLRCSEDGEERWRRRWDSGSRATWPDRGFPGSPGRTDPRNTKSPARWPGFGLDGISRHQRYGTAERNDAISRNVRTAVAAGSSCAPPTGCPDACRRARPRTSRW